MRRWLKSLLSLHKKRDELSDRQHAVNLIAAVDAGGIPLNTARVNHIARALGLEVSRHARVEDTLARIRAALRATSAP